MKSAKNWFNEMLLSGERRRAARQKTPRLIAFYWDGAAPAPHNIRDISLTGFYLLTDARWYPGTLITMTLQTTYKSEDGARRYIAVQSVVVRADVDGVGLAFAAQESHASNKEPSVEGTPVDKKTLDGFLKWIEGSRGEGSIEHILLLPLLLWSIVRMAVRCRAWGIAQPVLAAKMCRQVQQQFFRCRCKCRYTQEGWVYHSPQFSGSEQSFCLEASYSLSEILKASLVAPRRQAQRCSGRKS
jgi:hypothetical protein